MSCYSRRWNKVNQQKSIKQQNFPSPARIADNKLVILHRRCFFFFIITVLLTVIVPVGVSGQFAVQYGVFTIMFLIVTVIPSDHHPTDIVRAVVPVPVDVELATGILVSKMESKVVLILRYHVSPRSISQSILSEPVQLVWSLGVELQFLYQVSSFIKDNSCLLKSSITVPNFTRVCQPS